MSGGVHTMSALNGKIANGKMSADDIYENLPCHERMRNGGDDEFAPSAPAMDEEDGPSGGASGVQAQPEQQPQQENNNKIQNNLAMNSKDSLYATPLKKSERPKPQGATPKGRPPLPTRVSSVNVDDNLNNSAAAAAAAASERDVKIINAELEDRRIRDFLKDTSQMHKKIELHKEYQGSNFSYLARKEHFANLVQQNVVNDSLNGHQQLPEGIDQSLLGYKTLANEEEDKNLDLNVNESLDELEAKCNEKLEMLTNLHRNRSTERSQEDNEQLDLDLPALEQKHPLNLLNGKTTSLSRNGRPQELSLGAAAYLNREWVLKKIAMCLEQRASKKPIPVPPEGAECVAASSSGFFPRATSTHQAPNRAVDLPSLGYLVLGSNGSGKTSVCNDIIEGTSGTKGMLNRRLLACYFVNSQNPECHSLSMFIRSIILQILSHSSFVGGANATAVNNTTATSNDLTSCELETKQEPQDISSNEALPEVDQQTTAKKNRGKQRARL